MTTEARSRNPLERLIRSLGDLPVADLLALSDRVDELMTRDVLAPADLMTLLSASE